MENVIKIGFDAKRIARNASGLGNYGRTLINSLAEEGAARLLLYAPDCGREDLRAQLSESAAIEWHYPEGAHFRLQRDLWRAGGMVKDLRRDGVSLFHGLSGELPRGLRKAGIHSVVTIHDLIFLRHPEYYKPLDVWLYKRKFYRTLHEADRIVAISECTKRDIVYYSDYPEDRIDVIYQSCDTHFARPVSDREQQVAKEKYNLPDHFILNVGTVEERKNVLLAVRALTRLPQEERLVIVGRKTAYAHSVMEYAASHALADRIVMLHGVPNDDLRAIYHLASCFVYPSRYEGFGIPIIEAIQSGLPVVAATQSCLEEAGGPDSLYVDPDDDLGMAQAISEAERTREERVRLSREYIRRFENSNVARQMMHEYSMIMSGSDASRARQ